MHRTAQNIIAFCCASTLGCTNEVKSSPAFSLSTPAPIAWELSPADAVNVATRYAVDNAILLAGYGDPRVSSDVFEGERFWAVLYDGKSRVPGDHFMLLINDTTKDVEYVPGA